ncbi:MAG TPA: hypothetical protein VGN88_10220 [Phycisphaerae bacterium]|jgi:hypothetical protein
MLSTFKRGFLLLLLALTGWTAVVIAWAVYRTGRSPEVLSWGLSATLTQGFLLVISFAAFTALDRPSIRLLALFGMPLAALMLFLIPLYAWTGITDYRQIGPFSHAAHNATQCAVETGVLTAGLLCLVPFILIPNMKRIGRIVQLSTILYLTVAYITALLQIWQLDTQRVDEALTTLLIPAGACTFGVFALHKFLEIRQPTPLMSVDHAVQVRCPRCQSLETLEFGTSRCQCCRLKITIAVEEPKCPNCHFNLHHLTQPICPECGFHLDQDEVPAAGGGARPASDAGGGSSVPSPAS